MGHILCPVNTTVATVRRHFCWSLPVYGTEGQKSRGSKPERRNGTFPLHSTRSGTQSAASLDYRSLDVSQSVPEECMEVYLHHFIRLYDVLLNDRERCYMERGVKVYREYSGT